MKQLQRILFDFYNCTKIPIHVLDSNFQFISHTGLTMHSRQILDAKEADLYAHLIKHQQCLATFSCTEHLHFITFSCARSHLFNGHFIAGPFQSESLDRQDEMLFKPKSCLPHLEKLLKLIVEEHLVMPPEFDKYILESIHYIHQHYQHAITLDDVCQHLNLNKSYFCSLFKNNTNLTFCHFLNEVRIKKSKHHLIHSSDSILDIALLVGFNNPTYFSLTFKKIVGVTPLKFRKENLKTIQQKI